MNTSENSSSWHLTEHTAEGDTTPVLARVPWLLPAEEPAQTATEAQLPTFDPMCLEAHSLVVAADLETTTWDVSPPMFRIDPPHSHFSPMARAAPHPSKTDSRVSEAAPPRSVSRPPLPNAPDGRVNQASSTQLRFDRPQLAVPENAAGVDVEQSPPPSNWHTWLAAIDNSIRQYHRVIVLSALLTAAGLMMLVLESQHPASEPAPDVISPATVKVASPAAANDAAPSESIAVSEAMPAPLEMAAEQVSQARGPQSDVRRRTAAVEQEAAIPLEPIASPDALTPVEDITPIDEDLSDWSVSTNDVAPLPQVVGYPTTNAPAYVWPQLPSESAAPADTPSVARLSRELQPVGGETTK